jgi:hypothetical protein
LVTRGVPMKGFEVYPTSQPPFPSSTQRKDAASFCILPKLAASNVQRPTSNVSSPFSDARSDAARGRFCGCETPLRLRSIGYTLSKALRRSNP